MKSEHACPCPCLCFCEKVERRPDLGCQVLCAESATWQRPLIDDEPRRVGDGDPA